MASTVPKQSRGLSPGWFLLVVAFAGFATFCSVVFPDHVLIPIGAGLMTASMVALCCFRRATHTFRRRLEYVGIALLTIGAFIILEGCLTVAPR